MKSTLLEITAQEYLIKLDKNKFDLSFIQSLLKRIEHKQTLLKCYFDDEDIISRRSDTENTNHDDLSEK